MTTLFPGIKQQREPADPRHQPFLDFAATTYREGTGSPLIIRPRDIGAVRDMLKATKSYPDEYGIEQLKQYWLCYLKRRDSFEKKQPPLSIFCARIDRWADECGRVEKTSVDVAKDWMRNKLGKA